jgi:hypothetical protein
LLTVGASTAALVVSGCTLNNPFSTAKTPDGRPSTSLAPDVALAVGAVALLLEVDGGAQEAVRAYPRLGPRLAGLIAMHAAHLQALRAALPTTTDPTRTTAPTPLTTPTTPTTPPTAPPKLQTALAAQRVREIDLHDRLTGLALRAESGAFARLLGTMAAAVSQQLVELG